MNSHNAAVANGTIKSILSTKSLATLESQVIGGVEIIGEVGHCNNY